MTRRTTLHLVLCLLIAAPLLAQPTQPTLQISLGIRETGSTAAIGADGGTSGGIEWVDLDGQTLALDGTWQPFTFNLGDPMTVLTPFAGSTANGILDGTAGTIEHIRIRNIDGYDQPITLWIDDVTDTPPMGTGIIFGDFESPYIVGDEVMFQEPTFSGSTSGNIMAGATSAVDDTVWNNGSQSYKVDFQFVDNNPSKWIRLTTFAVTNLPNPTISFNDVISFSMRSATPFDHTIVSAPNGMDTDVTLDIVGGNPGSVVYVAMTVNNVGSAPNGWFFGIGITLQEIQAQIITGNPWIDQLDGSGSFNITLPVLALHPLSIPLDSVPIEFAPVTGVLSQIGPAHTWSL